MKKRITVSLLCMLLIFSFTACKGNTEENTTTSSTSTTETTTAQTTTEPTTEATTTTTTTTEASTTTTKKETTTKKQTTTKKTTTTTKKQTTTKKATEETTTKKKAYDPDPAYGTVAYSLPEGNYKEDYWSSVTVYYEWNGNSWQRDDTITISGFGYQPPNTEELYWKAVDACPAPTKKGKHIGEEYRKHVWIWMH